MFKVSSLDDFNLLRESSSIEFKLAGGRDGKVVGRFLVITPPLQSGLLLTVQVVVKRTFIFVKIIQTSYGLKHWLCCQAPSESILAVLRK